jgi:hypothetical protein
VKLLVVTPEPVDAKLLRATLGDEVEGAEVLVVSPATNQSKLAFWVSDPDEAIHEAEVAQEETVERLEEEGVDAAGDTGESEPARAIEDALATFPADEIVIITHPEGEQAPLEGDLFEQARREFAPPITHLSVGDADGVHGEAVDVEYAGAGVAPSERERRGRSRNLPALSLQDLAGILVAIVGTVVLVVLAATCSGSQVGEDAVDAGCVVRYILAGGVALVNIAHVVALFLFESVGYRGGWQRLFAQLSLWGTPAAIIISLLVH